MTRLFLILTGLLAATGVQAHPNPFAPADPHHMTHGVDHWIVLGIVVALGVGVAIAVWKRRQS